VQQGTPGPHRKVARDYLALCLEDHGSGLALPINERFSCRFVDDTFMPPTSLPWSGSTEASGHPQARHPQALRVNEYLFA